MTYLLRRTSSRLLISSLCLAAVFCLDAPRPSRTASAYTVQYTNNSATIPTRWNTPVIDVALSSSLASPPGNFVGGDIRAAAIAALDTWSAAANINFNIIDSNSPLQSVSQDGVSLITVANTSQNAALFPNAGNDILGRADITFNTENGFIIEGDVVLNPFRVFAANGANDAFDAEGVFAHEIGHLLGLDHSAEIGATMRPLTAFNNQYFVPETTARTLAADDVRGAESLYGARSSTPRGDLAGTVRDGAGNPVLGAHVWAESPTTGAIVGGNVTLASGFYRIAGLAPGEYNLRVETLDEPVVTRDFRFVAGATTPTFRAVEINGSKRRTFRPYAPRALRSTGGIFISSGQTTPRDIQVNTTQAPTINPQAVGVVSGDSGSLGPAAVPLLPGQSKTILIDGAGVTEALGAGGITSTSPFISVTNARFIGTDSRGLPVVAATVAVSVLAPAGNYSLRFRVPGGETAFLSGALTIETTASSVSTTEDKRSASIFRGMVMINDEGLYDRGFTSLLPSSVPLRGEYYMEATPRSGLPVRTAMAVAGG